jgi:hypothetical protein
MALPADVRKLIRDYCKRDIPNDLKWYSEQFSFVTDVELQNRLGRAFYSARYISKLMGALQAAGDEIHPFVKFQVIQYAAIYEAVITHLLWTRYKEDMEVKKIQIHKTHRLISVSKKLSSLEHNNEKIYTCAIRNTKTDKNSIPFKTKVDCAVKIGIIDSKYSSEIKEIYELRNMAHLEAEARKQINLEIKHAKTGYWRLRPFLEIIRNKIAKEVADKQKKKKVSRPK